MSNLNDLFSYPYWGTDKRQNTYVIAGRILTNELADLDINQEPGRTDYNLNYLPVLMRPAIRQDTSQMGTQAQSINPNAVTEPESLYRALLDSVPDVEV